MSITTYLKSVCIRRKKIDACEPISIGERLRNLRGDMSQAEVAKALGISPSAWSMYENNERIPRDELKIAIAKFFDTSVQTLFF